MKSMAIPLKCDGKLGRPVQVPRTKQVYERKLLSKPIDILVGCTTADADADPDAVHRRFNHCLHIYI